MKDLTDNEVLEVFMGLPLTKEVPKFSGGFETVPFRALKYHMLWEELMPVWYKFNDLGLWGNMKDRRTYTRFCSDIEDAILFKGPTPSEACKHLANAIRWYNTVKQ
jgi:hypothetical protein